MRIPDIINRCVCFLCVENAQGAAFSYKYGGTAFFVQVQHTPELRFPYLVTAKHCVEKARQYGGLKVRLNLKGGKGAAVVDLNGEWFYHDNPGSDVAVIPCLPSDEFDYTVLDTLVFAHDDVISQNHIGVGDELFISGLFTLRHGTHRNIPIVRTGVIASMPEEQLMDDHGNEYNAYLAEVRSIGGLSGSPVFVYLEPMRVVDHKEAPDLYMPAYFLLGMIRGHWVLGKKASGMDFLAEEENLNTGIAIVTPIAEVLDVLMTEELVKTGRKAQRERERMAPTRQSSST